MVTPIGIAVLMLFGNSLKTIYIVIFFIGLTYNPRSSTAYLYGTEFLEKKNHLNFGQANFLFSGIFQAFSGWHFWYFGDQNTYFAMLIVILLLAILWT